MNVPLGRLYLVAEVMQIGAPASPQTIFYFKFCIFALNRDLEIDVSFLPASPSQIIRATRGEHQIAFSDQMLMYLWPRNHKMHENETCRFSTSGARLSWSRPYRSGHSVAESANL